MYEYIIIGGGIESIIQAFLVSKNVNGSKIAFITQNNVDFSLESTTWTSSHRHVSIFEAINFLSSSHKTSLENTVEANGWLCKTESLNLDEKQWLNNRKLFCESNVKISEVNSFIEKFSKRSVERWIEFIRAHNELMKNTNINYGISLHSNINKIVHSDESFSFDAGEFCKNVISYLISKNVSFFFDTKISNVKFDNEKFDDEKFDNDNRIDYLVSNTGQVFQAKNYIFCPGVYGDSLFKIFNLRHRINGILGVWAMIKNVSIKKAFKYHHFEDNQLKACQSYTPIDQNKVIVGTGSGWVGNEFNNISKAQLEKFISIQKRIIEEIFPQKEIIIINTNCIRAFSDDNLPIIQLGKTTKDGNYIFISGTGTFTTAFAFIIPEIYNYA